MGRIRWTEKAGGHPRAIHDYIARDSAVYARRHVRGIIYATHKLEIMPYCGRKVPELENYNFREVIYRNYRIIYRVADADENIEILAVMHGAQDFITAFSEDWELQ
ncbi:type II toxin-antitoxin system RelE/ParE family toxin [Desulfobacterales bacterium HSG2]|nr:type II toxin-antitoxin system RelE/ParE family toxin [Desulfobacterales bacterium HSG2]